ncbi:DmpA family aminopeptidase [Pseudomonas wadenswilerensis]
MRARQLGITTGLGTPGELNAITDVPGVRVGHCTLIEGQTVRTGVTVIQPRAGEARLQPCFAGLHVLNGNGDATGLEWIREAGLLTTPIAFTNTHSVGVVRDALIAAERDSLADPSTYWCMPVVMETYDGVLNDIWGQHVRPEHVRAALSDARSGAVAEGAVGGGTGMICHEFKGGIGTASRKLPAEQGGWTVGALLQANHGQRRELRVDGYPVGRVLDDLPSPFARRGEPGMGSIVVVLATDAPLLPHQCQRLAQRASIGIARTGGGTEDSSGDLFLAFSTADQQLPPAGYGRQGVAFSQGVAMVNNDHISPLFRAAAEAVEEAIVNALLAGIDMQTADGVAVPALQGQRLLAALRETDWKPADPV